MQPLIDIILPVFLIILAGYWAGRRRLLGETASEALNLFVYFIALPPLLFISTARVEPERIFRLDFIAGYVLAVAGTGLLAVGVLVFVFRRNARQTALGSLAAYYGNTGFMGIPLMSLVFGAEGTLSAVIVTVIATLFMIAPVNAYVEATQDGRPGARRVAVLTLRSLSTNPLVIAPVAGIALSLLGLGVPKPVATFCDIVGSAATPCALFAIGLFLAPRSMFQELPEVATLSAIKLIVQPALVLALTGSGLIPLDPDRSFMLLVIAALPTAATPFVIAQRFGVYVHVPSAMALLTTVMSVLTLGLLLALRPG